MLLSAKKPGAGRTVVFGEAFLQLEERGTEKTGAEGRAVKHIVQAFAVSVPKVLILECSDIFPPATEWDDHPVPAPRQQPDLMASVEVPARSRWQFRLLKSKHSSWRSEASPNERGNLWCGNEDSNETEVPRRRQRVHRTRSRIFF